MKTDRAAAEAPGGTPVDQRVGRLAPERCKDCGLMLAPWLRLWCTQCVQKHLTE